MTDLTVRKLLIDLNTPFPARWNGGDAFRSAFFNALSMSFPVGEQYFMDSVRAGFKKLPSDQQAQFSREVQGFVGQEATHRRVHSLFNGHLEKLGFTNTLELRAKKRIEAHAHYDTRVHVAATAATEHLTAIFADWTLRHTDAFAGSEPRLQTLWQWHAAEESEHRSTAFDIYCALGGSHPIRVKVFQVVTAIFLFDVMRQTVRNLWKDNALFALGTWRSAWRLLMSKEGMFRSNYHHWRAYKEADFHPMQQDGTRGVQWLQEHTHQFTPVVAAAGAAV